MCLHFLKAIIRMVENCRERCAMNNNDDDVEGGILKKLENSVKISKNIQLHSREEKKCCKSFQTYVHGERESENDTKQEWEKIH